jgi:transcriptional regulator with XRE-family HTH domain
MPRKEKVDRGCAPAGSFGHMLFTARHKAGKSIAAMSRASGLSGPYLVHIERGIRSPVPNKVPAIAAAYGVDSSEACWSWVTSFAPQMVRHLVKVEGAAAKGEKQAATSHEAVQGTIAPGLLHVDPSHPLPESLNAMGPETGLGSTGTRCHGATRTRPR